MKKSSSVESKYAHLINEPVNQGKEYCEYRETAERKKAPAKAARLKQLKRERAERIKKFGKIEIPKYYLNRFQLSTVEN